MKFSIAVLIVISVFFSCGNNPDENQIELPKNDISIIFGNKNYEYPELSIPAKEQAVKWGVLEDLILEAKNLNGSNYQDLRNHSERVREFSDSLIKKIPDTLNTKPINSRLIVLKTRSQLLFQTAHLSAIDSLGLQNSVTELNTAITNLIVHLNEKFQKDNIDFQRKEDEENELKKQQRFRDSVMNLELQDINNK